MSLSLLDPNPSNESVDLDRLVKEVGEFQSGTTTTAGTGEQAYEVQEQQAPAKAVAERPDWCPVKFWDAENGQVMIEKMGTSYVNLESSHGRMANDLGTQRKLTDAILGLKRETELRNNSTPETPKVTSEELYENPTQAIERVLNARDKQRDSETHARLTNMELALAQERFVVKHPDYMTVAQSSEFGEWARATPYRARLASMAAQNDFAAADELLTEFKATVKPAKAAAEAEGVAAARKVGLESGTSAGAAKKKKVWKRTDLQMLQLKRPDLYYDDAFQAEIIQAFADDRVV